MSDNVPYESFEAADGWIYIACGNNKLWLQFCQAMARPDLADHPDYATNNARRAHYAALMAIVRPLIAGRSRAHWEQAFVACGVPFAPVNTLPELARHPQVQASGMVQEYSSPQFGVVKTVARAVRFDGEVARVGQPPPALGAHTRQVLGELGYSATEIEALLAAQVVA